jgi:hypothetical protein
MGGVEHDMELRTTITRRHQQLHDEAVPYAGD